ncbi:MAG: TIGR03617 family F420-dependent LLM class oxidoreductase [Anaerolineae bacterium]|jgi:probable F420-dependent oxidoreductase|nr:TIGR03617 family F420-dependent LLM class oxidoreductase [Anaerolineae bacterium]MBT7075126.1 TIGR03617 family F420-dependent LLM class oxidoreductase [Anaerolineae bacterium]MBT7782215.1 TIGR03617 family F420-dependent LLM class oxidoreductase [Anaerolineae bacterium]
MKFDAVLPPMPLKNVPKVACAAEEMGFDTLWTTETQHDAFLPHPLIANSTSKINMGTAIAISFARSPGDMAYTAWDLAAQSEGRFILGLGTQVKGHITKRFGMPWPDSVVGKLREQIGAIRALWNTWQIGEKLRYSGEYYKLRLMTPFFNPGKIAHPDIPIYIAGVNTGLARLAGEICNGFHAHPFNTPRYLEEILIPAIEEGASKTNRSRKDVAISLTAFIATTPEEANQARMQIAFYASTPSYKRVMDLYGWGDTAEKLRNHVAKGEWSEMPMLITDEMLEEFVTYADSPADLPAALKKRYAGMVDRITIYTPFLPGEKDDFWKKMVGAF